MGIGFVKVQLKDLVRTTIDIELLLPIPSLYSVWLVGVVPTGLKEIKYQFSFSQLLKWLEPDPNWPGIYVHPEKR